MKNVTGNAAADITRTDLLYLLRVIKSLLEDLEYVTVPVWKTVTSNVIAAFVRGRGLPHSAIQAIADRMQAFSIRSRTPEAIWWADWKSKSLKMRSESRRKVRKPSQDILDFLFPKMAVPIDDFGYCMVDQGTECVLVTLGGFVHVVSDVDQLEKLGLEVLNAAAEIKTSRIVNTTDLVGEQDGIYAVEDWTDQIAADAWLLKPPVDEEDIG